MCVLTDYRGDGFGEKEGSEKVDERTTQGSVGLRRIEGGLQDFFDNCQRRKKEIG